MANAWKPIHLGEALEVFHGYAFPSDAMSESLTGEPIIVSIGNFDYRGGFRFDSTRIRQFTGDYPRQFDLTPGELLVAMTCQTPDGAILGLPGMVPADGRTYLHNQRIGRVVVNESRMDRRFAYYCFLSPDVKRQLVETATGTKILHTAPGRIHAVRIHLPSIYEQQSISTVLGALDDKIHTNKALGETALELAASAYAQATEASDWGPISLDKAARWCSGGTPRTSEASYWNGNIPWISALSLKSPWIDDSDRKLTALGAENGTRTAPSKTVIIIVRGSSLNTEFRIGITQREVAFSQDCKALTPAEDIDPDLLFHAIRHRTQDVLDRVDQTGIGAGRLATDLLKNLIIRVPLYSNDPVVERLQTLNTLAAAQQRESRTLKELRDALLPKLMSGELRVRDAEKVVEEAT